MNINSFMESLTKKAKQIALFLLVNLFIALLYTIIINDLTLDSLSNALFYIGGIYFILGGMSTFGRFAAVSDYNNNFSYNQSQWRSDNSKRDSFMANMMSYGVATLLLSFIITGICSLF